MKIVHLTSVHYRYDTRIFVKECGSLISSGYEVSLVVADGQGDEVKDGVRIYDVGYHKHRILRILFSTRKVVRKAKELSADIFHLHDPELLPFGVLLKWSGRKIVFDMHENLPKQILSKEYLKPPFHSLLSAGVSLFQRVVLKSVPVVFAEDSYIEDFKGVRRSTTVLNFPVLSKILTIKPNPSHDFTIGYMGEISKERGAILILEILQQLRSEGSKIHALFVGPVRDEVLGSSIYGVAIKEGWATFTGRLNPEEAWTKISRCSLGAALLYPSPNFIDSYPTKLFEYMALGIPVMVSDFPINRKIIVESGCGMLVNPEDGEAVKEIIRFFYENRIESQLMGEKGKKYVSDHFNWDAEFLKLLELYKEIHS